MKERRTSRKILIAVYAALTVIGLHIANKDTQALPMFARR